MDLAELPLVVSERRGHARRRVLKNALIVFSSGHCTMKCQILEMSDSGAKLLPADSLLCPSEFVLKPQIGEPRQCEVRWRMGTKIGVSYHPLAGSQGDRADAEALRHEARGAASDVAQESAFDVRQDLAVLHRAIESSIAHGKGGENTSAFLVVSITNLSFITELLGKVMIEPALSGLAWRLRDCLRSGDVIGRLSANRFGIVLPYVRDNGAAVVANKIMLLSSTPAITSRGPVELRLSVESVLFPAENLSATEILRRGVKPEQDTQLARYNTLRSRATRSI